MQMYSMYKLCKSRQLNNSKFASNNRIDQPKDWSKFVHVRILKRKDARESPEPLGAHALNTRWFGGEYVVRPLEMVQPGIDPVREADLVRLGLLGFRKK